MSAAPLSLSTYVSDGAHSHRGLRGGAETQMDHNKYIANARAFEEAAKLRRSRARKAAEVSRFLSGGIHVLTGLMLAVLFCIVQYQSHA